MIKGIIGIENVYTSAITRNVFQLSGPTLFQPILQKAKAIANIAHNKFIQDKVNNRISYYILLILTDGVINDSRQTINEIVDIANKYLPLSVIIVGVGNADFKQMDELDADKGGLMNSQGTSCKRDIVQFVPMNKYKNNMSLLSSEVLKEIPTQFLSYTRYHNIKPAKRKIPKVENIVFAMSQVGDDEKGDDSDDGMEGLISPTQTILNQDNDYWDTVPLPLGWERAYDENGRTYYVDNINKKTQWKHPGDTK